MMTKTQCKLCGHLIRPDCDHMNCNTAYLRGFCSLTHAMQWDIEKQKALEWESRTAANERH